MAEGNATQTYLIVHPEALLRALDLVEQGHPATDVMASILDIARENTEEDDE